MTREPYFFFTVDVEEWFTSTKLVNIQDDQQYKRSSKIEEAISWILKLLEETKISGTFFFIQDIAERYPSLVRRILSEGHEIALHGETHEHLAQIQNEEFAAMLKRTREFFQNNFNISLKGYRAPYFSIHKDALALLKTSGFVYDSSVVPSIHIPGWYGVPKAPRVPYFIGQTLEAIDPVNKFLEFPLSVHPLLKIPGLGGYYFRNLGLQYTQHLLRSCLRRLGYAIFYLHPWELSEVPKIPGMPFYMRRHTGQWTRTALRFLLQSLRADYAFRSSTLQEFYNTFSHTKNEL